LSKKTEVNSVKNSEQIYQTKLKNVLKEISGLAVTDDGRLFGHNDELGVIYEINPKTGEIIKRFELGTFGITGDFEGLAFANSKFYLTESNGTLYEFSEGSNNSSVKFKTFKTGFSSKFEIEGLCYYPESNVLLFASKDYPGKNYKGFRTVYAFSLESYSLLPEPFLKVEIDKINSELKNKGFFPSGIEYNKFTNTFFIISSKGQKAIVELNTDGELLKVEKLKGKYHKQPEGIAFLHDGTMVIADEGVKGNATLTVYPAPNK
jgi:uncharacterized protein YjiK